jgi:hypothetical protein
MDGSTSRHPPFSYVAPPAAVLVKLLMSRDSDSITPAVVSGVNKYCPNAAALWGVAAVTSTSAEGRGGEALNVTLGVYAVEERTRSHGKQQSSDVSCNEVLPD